MYTKKEYHVSMEEIGKAMSFATLYYTREGLAHACRVAAAVAQNPLIPPVHTERCFALALMHDLVEDTVFQLEQVQDPQLREQLRLLTHDKEVMDYMTYICNIPKGSPAYWVKIADIKDHLSLSITLTDKLTKKYCEALAVLL